MEETLTNFDADADVLAVQPRAHARERLTTHRAPARSAILMCAPDHFGVDYIINPWMENQVGQATLPRAKAQWEYLRRSLAAHSDIAFVAPTPGLPDMVFTANAGLAIGGTAVVSRFHARERRPEERLFGEWFEAQGYSIAPWPSNVAFEGAGDALVDHARGVVWCGYGWRSDEEAPRHLEKIFGRRAIALKLVDPRFYHLDTCFCPLSGGWAMYYPAAFDIASQEAIRAIVPAEKRIEVAERDALSFACNAVEVGGRVFLNACSDDLRARLIDAGFAPVVTPLSEFMKAGGAAKCLTLQLPGAAASMFTPQG
ncbi:MAG: dimethylarginine dimethylaminohydrolase family protein [Methylocystis sp.]|uniref:dimethylarginine dimethylaminohydrolase family protein n=1 Tax=Methylocystis sp. TaxID=1911079 RepID=UPI003D13AF42